MLGVRFACQAWRRGIGQWIDLRYFHNLKAPFKTNMGKTTISHKPLEGKETITVHFAAPASSFPTSKSGFKDYRSLLIGHAGSHVLSGQVPSKWEPCDGLYQGCIAPCASIQVCSKTRAGPP